MLNLQVSPGFSVGPFQIGMNVNACLEHLRLESFATLYPIVDVKFSDKDLYSDDLVLELVDSGIQLKFSPRTQRLNMIDIFQLKPRLTYNNRTFSSLNEPPTFAAIYALFGLSQPGVWSPESKSYLLKYPGISFYFEIPPQYAQQYSQAIDLPLELPDGSSPKAIRIHVHSSQPFDDKSQQPLAVSSNTLIAKIGQGVQTLTDSEVFPFGAPLQDVVDVLGTPTAILHKHTDPMAMYAQDTASSDDYMFSYKSRGVDVLVDGANHTIKKFVLRCNVPNHVQFGVYDKCSFVFAVDGKLIDPNAKWLTLRGCLGLSSPEPLVNDHGRNHSPFGPTYYYCYPGLIVEVTRSDEVASVTLFAD